MAIKRLGEAGEIPALPAAGVRTSLRDEAIQTLQAAIIAGELRPGIVYSAITHNKADLEFHTRLLAVHGNAALVDTVGSLRTRSRLYGMAALANADRLLPSSREHVELLGLIRARDVAGAQDLMRRHLSHVRGSWATGEEPAVAAATTALP